MKSTEKFFRETHADGLAAYQSLCESLPRSQDAKSIADIETALKVFADAINILADHDKQAKARRERIQWLPVGNGIYVAKVGRETYRYRSASNYGLVERFCPEVQLWHDVGRAGTSVESASRLIRRLKGTKK